MARIGIDLFELAAFPFRGIARYERNLVSALAESMDPCHELVLFWPRSCPIPANMPDLVRRQIHLVGLTLKQRKLVWLLSHLCRINLDNRLSRLNAFHSPDMVGPRLNSTPLILTVHDLAPFVCPETRTLLNTVYLRMSFSKSIRLASRVIVDSETVGREVSSHTQLPADRISVIPLAADPVFSQRTDEAGFKTLSERIGLHRPYFLTVGTLEPRKNHAVLLDAFAALRSEVRTIPAPQLLIVGKPGWKYRDIQRRAKALNPGNDIVLVDSVTDEDLCKLYVHCIATIYPSLYEGFGLPILEAMSCGSPVIASDIPVLREVGGKAALYAAPGKPGEFKQCMQAVQAAGLRAELTDRGLKQAQLFSWQKTASRTWKVYTECSRKGETA